MADHEASKKKVAVALLPIPAMGHLVAMVELAKRLLLHGSAADCDVELAITILNIQPIIPNPHISSYLTSVSSSHPGITIYDLPKVELPPGTKPEALIVTALQLHRPLVRDALQAIRGPVAALVLDLFCTAMIDVAKELGIPPYIFFTSSAAFLGLAMHLPAIAPQLPVPDQYEGKTLPFPGFVSPLPLMSMPDGMTVHFLPHFSSMYPEVKGILINTFAELESASMKALEEGVYHLKAQATYAVGPILSLEHEGKNKGAGAAARSDGRHECIRWLDEQPPASVVFLCFGSEGTFPAAQVREIAAGLERSGQRFLWVLRSPPAQAPQTLDQKQQGGAVQRSPGLILGDAVLEEVLPEGFLERTRNRGMVWPSFAPQAEILAHASVGGFVTHCGWNSCLESLWYGVPMAAWPLFAEQPLNGFQMAREIGVAVKVHIDRNRGNAVTADEVERAVNALMGQEEGAKVREKAAQIKSRARSALHEGGSSFLALQKFVQELICLAT